RAYELWLKPLVVEGVVQECLSSSDTVACARTNTFCLQDAEIVTVLHDHFEASKVGKDYITGNFLGLRKIQKDTDSDRNETGGDEKSQEVHPTATPSKSEDSGDD